jgi:hypothetical protein
MTKIIKDSCLNNLLCDCKVSCENEYCIALNERYEFIKK